jgi:hypothetical protein
MQFLGDLNNSFYFKAYSSIKYMYSLFLFYLELFNTKARVANILVFLVFNLNKSFFCNLSNY